MTTLNKILLSIVSLGFSLQVTAADLDPLWQKTLGYMQASRGWVAAVVEGEYSDDGDKWPMAKILKKRSTLKKWQSGAPVREVDGLPATGSLDVAHVESEFANFPDLALADSVTTERLADRVLDGKEIAVFLSQMKNEGGTYSATSWVEIDSGRPVQIDYLFRQTTEPVMSGRLKYAIGKEGLSFPADYLLFRGVPGTAAYWQLSFKHSEWLRRPEPSEKLENYPQHVRFDSFRVQRLKRE